MPIRWYTTKNVDSGILVHVSRNSLLYYIVTTFDSKILYCKGLGLAVGAELFELGANNTTFQTQLGHNDIS